MSPSRQSAREGHVPISMSVRPLWVQGLLPFLSPAMTPNEHGDQPPVTTNQEGDGSNQGSRPSG
jgi:hypothetical protein